MKQRIAYLIVGIGIGMLLASYLAWKAAENRDTLIVGMYEGFQGADSFSAELNGDLPGAYVHSANQVAIMERGKEILGLDKEPWDIWYPYTSLVGRITVGSPPDTWNQALIAYQKKRTDALKEKVLNAAVNPAKGKTLPQKQSGRVGKRLHVCPRGEFPRNTHHAIVNE